MTKTVDRMQSSSEATHGREKNKRIQCSSETTTGKEKGQCKPVKVKVIAHTKQNSG